MKELVKIVKNKDGQALLIVALLMVVLMGFAALVIDIGSIYLTKSQMQNAADAAALAGAVDLPNASTAKETAKNYAEKNGAEKANTTPTTPYKGDSAKIEVVCTKNVHYSFARVLGFTDTNVSARAVAISPKWAGDALPFINLDTYGSPGATLNAWNKVNPGDKERIHNDDLVISPNNIKVMYEDGSIMFKKGKDLSEVEEPLKNILKDGNIVYLFAIKNDLVGKEPYDKLDNKHLIPIEDTVLLRCKVIGNFKKNNDKITLELEKIYNYDSITNNFPVENPPPKLVE